MNALSEPAASTKDAAIHWSLRDIPLSHGKHVCGRVAWTPPPQSVPVESDLEAEAVAFFTQQPDLAAIHAQPFTINYSDHGAPRRYTPDLLVVFNRLSRVLVQLGFQRWTVVEVKAASLLDANREDIARRLAAVRTLLGFATVLLTERELGQVGGRS